MAKIIKAGSKGTYFTKYVNFGNCKFIVTKDASIESDTITVKFLDGLIEQWVSMKDVQITHPIFSDSM